MSIHHSQLGSHILIVNRHRYPDVHACTPSGADENPSEATSKARALLAKHFGSGTTKAASNPSTSSAPSSASPKSAQVKKVEMMKMRHKAVPADPKDKPASVPATARLHVRVRVEDSEDEKIFWLKKVNTVWFLKRRMIDSAGHTDNRRRKGP